MAKLGCLLPAKTERMWVWKVERISMAKHVSRVALSFINKLMARYQKKTVILQRDSGRLSRVGKAGARKVGTAQSTILLNRKVPARATASATETYRL